MLPFLRENVMEFERRTQLESEQVTDAVTNDKPIHIQPVKQRTYYG
jgi:hypothetical protein